MSELPRRTSRRSLGPRDAQRAEADTSIGDTSARPPTAAGVRMTDAAPSAIGA